jgi:cell division protein FtsB
LHLITNTYDMKTLSSFLAILFCLFIFHTVDAQSVEVQKAQLDQKIKLYNEKFEAFTKANKALLTEIDQLSQLITLAELEGATSLNDEEAVTEEVAEAAVKNAAVEFVSENTVATEAPEIKDNETTTVKFETESHHYGTITDGEKVEYIFYYTNTGSVPLVISNAFGSCGCTVPEWSGKPLAPGEKGSIKVIFNSTGKGIKNTTMEDSRKVTVIANTDPKETYLTLKGNIKGPKQ